MLKFYNLEKFQITKNLKNFALCPCRAARGLHKGLSSIARTLTPTLFGQNGPKRPVRASGPKRAHLAPAQALTLGPQ